VAGSEPVRTCIGCRETAAKSRLIRLVRRKDGSVGIDRWGTAPGRGAYVHGPDCLTLAAKRRALGRATRTALQAGEAARLRKEMEETTEA
jgi:predicted RNA-binding protein YlxR (DUF448 family)